MLSLERKQEIALRFLLREIFNKITVLGDGFPETVARAAVDLEIAIPELMAHAGALMEEQMNKLFPKIDLGGKDRGEKEQKRDQRVRARQGAIALLILKRIAVNQGLDISIKALRRVEQISERIGISFDEGMEFYIDLVNGSVEELLAAHRAAASDGAGNLFDALTSILGAMQRPSRSHDPQG